MKVRGVFANPDFSSFTKTAVEVGEALENQGWKLLSEQYSQGTQTFHFGKGEFLVDVHIEEGGEDNGS